MSVQDHLGKIVPRKRKSPLHTPHAPTVLTPNERDELLRHVLAVGYKHLRDSCCVQEHSDFAV
jgi:hypothetical protein